MTGIFASTPSSGRFAARSTLLVSAVLACLSVSPSSFADEIGIYSTLGAYRTDNVLRDGTEVPNRLTNVSTATVGTYGNKETKRLKTDWSAGVVYQHYTDDTIDPQTYGDIYWTLDAQLVPRRLIWHVADNLGQVLIDSTQPDMPLNRASFNSFVTGPELDIPLSAKMGITASGEINKSTSDAEALGGDSQSAEVGLVRLLSGRSSGAFRLSHTEGEFKGATISDYDTDRAYLHYEIAGGLTTLSADFGVNRAVIPVVTDNLPYYDLEIVRTLPSGSSLEVSFTRELTNVSEQFGDLAGNPYPQGQGPAPSDIDDTTRALDINTLEALYEAWTTRVRYIYQQGKTDIRVGLSRRDEYSLTGTIATNQSFDILEGSWYRIVSSKTGIRFWTVFTDRDLASDRSDFDTEVGLELARPIYSRAFRWVLTLSRYERESTDPLAEYTELRFGALLRYSKFIFRPRRNETGIQ